MSDWTAGYVTDIGYTYGYYQELNPQRVRLAFLNAGLVCPKFNTACELGFGQGVSINVHAAASDTQWYGTDFNPAQAGFAQELAAASGAPIQVSDEAFSEFANRADLPDFDFIGLHGIWSWISTENRKVIQDFVRRKLKVGGVLFISYNTLPGWGPFAPMRHLMTEHAKTMGARGQGIVKTIDGAIEFGTKLLAIDPTVAKVNPNLAPRLEKMKEHPRQYLAHEYFNEDWHPMYFSDMEAWLSEAKLSYACSAHLFDHVDVVNLTPDQRKFLNDITSTSLRETARDLVVNQQFRRDYWVKGARQLDHHQKEQVQASLEFLLTVPRDQVSLKINASLGELNLKEDLYQPLLTILADHKPHSLKSLTEELSGRVLPAQLNEMLVILSGLGHLAITQDGATEHAVQRAAKLNKHITQKVFSGNEVGFLASPVTGGGVGVQRFHQLFIQARKEGFTTTDEWAGFVWQTMNGAGQRILREGKALESAQENLAELRKQALEFEEKTLPILISLGLA